MHEITCTAGRAPLEQVLAVHGIGGHLREWRKRQGISQKDASTLLRVPSRTYQDYERSVRLPGAEAMEAFVRAGINANWLLTGDGPMLISELSASDVAAPLEKELLYRLIEMIEDVLEGLDVDLTPQSKAHVLSVLYDLCVKLDQREKVDRAFVESLIGLAA